MEATLLRSGRVNRSSYRSSAVDTRIVGRGVVAPLRRLALDDRELVGECGRGKRGIGGSRVPGALEGPSTGLEGFKRGIPGILDFVDLDGVRCAAILEPNEDVDVVRLT
jgi:hypothetical protein